MDIEQLCLPGLQMEEYRIPRFIVTDDAYVEVSEHKTSVMTAMAESSLSKNSSEVAMYVIRLESLVRNRIANLV